MVSTRDSYFDTDFEFNSDDGLMIAFGLTAYDDNLEAIDDADYGELKAYYKTWGMKDDLGVEFIELATTYCTKAQLGLNEDGSQSDNQGLFYATHKGSVNDLKNYYRKFKCLDSQ